MVFLEAWLFGKRLLGRDLPEITRDFASEGLELRELYPEFQIPNSWIDAQAYWTAIKPTLDKVYHEFGLPEVSDSKLIEQIGQILSKSTVDFARLPTALQRNVIGRAKSDSSAKQQLLDKNSDLKNDLSTESELISGNAHVIREHYSPKIIGQRLLDVYATVWKSIPASTIASLPQGQAILENFLRFDRLHPVRVEI